MVEEFLEGFHEEGAFAKVGMREGELFCLHLDAFDCHDVDVEETVGVCSVRVSVAVNEVGRVLACLLFFDDRDETGHVLFGKLIAEPTLNLLQRMEDVERRFVGTEDHCHIEEFIFRFEAPGLGFHYVRKFEISETSADLGGGARKIAPAVAAVGAYVDKH